MKKLSDIINEINRIIESEGDIPVYQYIIKDFSGTTKYTALFDGEMITYNSWIRFVQTFPDEFK